MDSCIATATAGCTIVHAEYPIVGRFACRIFDPGTCDGNICLANMSREADHPCRREST
jgi:hypothetical protein